VLDLCVCVWVRKNHRKWKWGVDVGKARGTKIFFFTSLHPYLLGFSPRVTFGLCVYRARLRQVCGTREGEVLLCRLYVQGMVSMVGWLLVEWDMCVYERNKAIQWVWCADCGKDSQVWRSWSFWYKEQQGQDKVFVRNVRSYKRGMPLPYLALTFSHKCSMLDMCTWRPNWGWWWCHV